MSSPSPAPPAELTEQQHKELLQVLLTEYTTLRAEAQHNETHQIELAMISFSALAALIAAAATFSAAIPENIEIFFFFLALPCLVMFLGLLWIDLIYRRTRFGCYTKCLENKINALVPQGPGGWKSIEFEHWIQDLEDGTGFFNTTRFFRGYIISGSWLAAPLLIMASYFLLSEVPPGDCWDAVLSLAAANWLATIFMAAVYGIYYLLFFQYLKKIIAFPEKVP